MYNVIGMNEDTAALVKFCEQEGITLLSVINDYSEDTLFNGVPVKTSQDFNVEYPVINCVSSVVPVIVTQKLEKRGAQVIDLVEFYSQLGVECKPKMCTKLAVYRKDFSRKFLDERSAVEYDAVTEYLETGLSRKMSRFGNLIDMQYLDIAEIIKPTSFIDCGGFDGDTSELFLDKLQTLSEVHFFEPSPENMESAKKRLARFDKRIVYYPCGLSDSSQTLNISSDGSASTLTSAEGTKVQVKALDDMNLPKVDLLKIDIEGHELSMLQGAKNYISSYKPNVAVAVYHKSEDVIEIPDFLLSCNSEYALMFRHYSQGWSESIMYFINTETQHRFA